MPVNSVQAHSLNILNPAEWFDFSLGNTVEDWLNNQVSASITTGLVFLKDKIIAPETVYVNSSTVLKWASYMRIVGWSLLLILFASRLLVTMGGPFFHGDINLDRPSQVLLPLIGGGFMIMVGYEFLLMLKYLSFQFTEAFRPSDFSVLDSTNEFLDAGYELAGLVSLLVLSLLFVVLNALYVFRDFFIDFLYILAPVIGGTIAFSLRFFHMWWQYCLIFVLMKPLHAFGIAFYLEYVNTAGINPIDQVLLSLIFFGIIIALPFIIFGAHALHVIRSVRSGGGVL